MDQAPRNQINQIKIATKNQERIGGSTILDLTKSVIETMQSTRGNTLERQSENIETINLHFLAVTTTKKNGDTLNIEEKIGKERVLLVEKTRVTLS